LSCLLEVDDRRSSRAAFVVDACSAQFSFHLLTQNTGAGLAGGFMAYCSSSNPFFMVDKHKRKLGDAGESASRAFCSFIYSAV
jgi:hypothetical protein